MKDGSNNKSGSFGWHELSSSEAMDKMQSSGSGLSKEEVLKRRQEFGPNALAETMRESIAMMLFKQFKDFMILVLMAAALVAGFLGEPSDTIVIVVIVLLNAILGFVQEYRAEKAMAALKKLAALTANLIRQGRPETLPADR